MKRSVSCLLPNDTVQTAARRMRDRKIGFLPICDSSGRVVGALTDRDLAIRVIAETRPLTVFVADVMTRDVVSCKAKDDVRTAEQVMAHHRKSRILCLDDAGKLVGVISLSDIAQRDTNAQAGKVLRQVTQREARVP